MTQAQPGDEVEPGNLTVRQIAELLGSGKLTEEQLGDTGLADAFWGLQRSLDLAWGDPVFRAELREKLMREATQVKPVK